MKLREYKFESKEELDLVASSVLAYLGIYICPEDINFTSMVYYKFDQLDSLLDGKYNITPEDLMMYLSCPIGVENNNDIKNFGLRTDKEAGNGKINMHFSKMLLLQSFLATGADEEYQDRIFDYELDQPDTLLNSSDYLDLYAPSMLDEPVLLTYLFLTGRGNEFTRIYRDVDFLKKLENGSFTGDEIKERFPKVSKGKDKASELLKSFVKEDILKIEKLNKEKQEGNVLRVTNKTL